MKYSELSEMVICKNISTVALDYGITVADDKLTLNKTPLFFTNGIFNKGFKIYGRETSKDVDLTDLPDGNLWIGLDIDGSTKYKLEKNKPFNIDEDPIWYRHQLWMDTRIGKQLNCTGAYLEEETDPFDDGKLNNFWKLNGNADDAEGNNDGTLNGDATFIDMDTPIRDGGKILTLDGDGDYVSTDFKIGTQTKYTLSAWFKTDANQDGCILASAPNDNTCKYIRGNLFLNSSGKIGIGMGDDNDCDDKKIECYKYNDNTWHNLLVSIDGYNQTVYFDGKNLGTYTLTISAGTSSDGSFSIGRKGEYDGYYFKGQISQVKIFLDKALTEDEVIETYNEQRKQFEPVEKPISFLPYKIEIQDEKAKSIVKDDRLFDNVLGPLEVKGNVDIKGNINTNGGIVTGKNQCTAWVNFDGTNGTIRDSYNVSSVVRTDVGKYTIVFEVEMDNSNYSVGNSVNFNDSQGAEGTINVTNFTTTEFKVDTERGTTDTDAFTACLQVFGGK